MNRHKILLRTSLFALLAFGSAPVWAQQKSENNTSSPPAIANNGDTGLQDIIVTASKREENLQKTSTAVTAVTSADLRALGVQSAIDLTQVVPNLSVSQYGNGATTAMRGVVSLNQGLGGDPAVSFSVDGIDMARNHSAVQGIFDIARVEVLRGPQGTLQGRNAAAGSINVITNKPDLARESYAVTFGYGNYSAISGTGVANIPISDTLGIRFAINSDRHDGYVKTTPNNRRWNDLDFIGGRLHLLWKPSVSFSALLSLDASHSGGAGNGGANSGAPLGLYAPTVNAKPYAYQLARGDMYLDEDVKGGTLTLKWFMPIFDVTYLGSVRRDNFVQAAVGAVYGPLSRFCPTASSTECFAPLINGSDDRQMSHELRVSQDSGSLKWVAGLYYLKAKTHYNQVYQPDRNSNGTRWRLTDTPDYVNESRAVFGQATWSLTDQVRLVGGLRYTEDKKSFLTYTYVGPVGSISDFVCTGCTLTGTNSGSGSWHKVTWRAGVDFDVSPRSMLFASVSTGYKEGGVNNALPPYSFPYGPESLINYELGSKNRFFDNRLQLNIDAFWTSYSDYQASAGAILPTGASTNLTVNAGKAEIKGVELESIFLATAQDKISLNATYLDAKFTKFFLDHGDGFSPGATFTPYDLSGNQLPYAPHFTARLSYEHSFPLGEAGTLVARVDSGYTAHQYLDYHSFRAVAQKAYTRTGASLTWQRSDAFSVQLYVRNIENKAVLAGAQPDSQAPARNFNDFAKEGIYMAPRTYGVRLNAAF